MIVFQYIGPYDPIICYEDDILELIHPVAKTLTLPGLIDIKELPQVVYILYYYTFYYKNSIICMYNNTLFIFCIYYNTFYYKNNMIICMYNASCYPSSPIHFARIGEHPGEHGYQDVYNVENQ